MTQQEFRCVFCGVDLTNLIQIEGQAVRSSGYAFSERNGETWMQACHSCVSRALRRYYSIRKYEKRVSLREVVK